MRSSALLSAFAAVTANAAPTQTRASYNCVDFEVPFSFAGTYLTPNFPKFQNHYQTVQFLNDITARNASSGPGPFGAAAKVFVDVTIAAQYCSPHGRPNGIVQILTHGIGFDRSYWDFGGPQSEYNYIKTATEAGYSTLSYDRIGNGKSTKADPYTVEQLSVETEILILLTKQLRTGGLSNHTNSFHIPKPEKVAHVGHSFGSIISESLGDQAPSLSDAMVLTGFSGSSDVWAPRFGISTNLHIAAENNPQRFGHLSRGYLTWGDELSNQYGFFYYPQFDPEVLKQVEETKWPFAVSEFLQATTVKAPNWKGPTLVLTGAQDRIFCGSDCVGILAETKEWLPNAEPFETYVQPNTGHGINLHFNATGAYAVMNAFVKAQLGA